MLNNLLNNPSVGFGWSVRAGEWSELTWAQFSILTSVGASSAGFLTIFMMLVALATLKQRLPPRRGHTHFLDWRVFKDPAYTFIVAGASIVMMGLYVSVKSRIGRTG